jgi:asparagine synthase (glutamine-hydrolysing)
VAFASEKKSLIAISGYGEKIRRLLPGHMATLDGKHTKDFCFWKPDSIRTSRRIKDKEEALRAYGEALLASVRKRVAGKKQVGILFSGGIDSLIICSLVEKLGVPFTCYASGRDGAPDIEWAQNVAKRFNYCQRLKTLTLEEIEQLVPQIISTIEDHSLNQVKAAIPFYAAARIAQGAGERVIFTGQGSDEISGGYPWYSTIVDQEGYESFEQYSWEDTFLGYKETFERENKIATAHGLEMSVPYVDPEVVEVAFQISPRLKIRRGNDQVQKRIHREFAVSIGIPEEIAFRKKEAAQHGAHIHTSLEQLAKKMGVTESMLEDAGYDPDQSVIEKLGSSSRYGFRYGDRHLWKTLPHVQYYLDSWAAVLNLLPPKSRIHWDATKHRLELNSTLYREDY